MDCLLIDYGLDSFKIMRSKNDFNQAKKLYKIPNQKIDFDHYGQVINNEVFYVDEIQENTSCLKDIFHIKKKDSFLLSMHLDFEFKKQSFIEGAFSTMFEGNGFDSGQILMQPIAYYLALKKDNSGDMLIIDSGEESTYIIPICQHLIVQDSIERSNLGGQHVTDNLQTFLQKKYPDIFVNLNRRKIQQIKEQNLKICPDYQKYKDSVLINYPWYMKRITLPDNQVIKLEQEVFELTESLFSPKNFGLDGRGIGERLYNCIKKSPIDLRLSLMDKIAFVGGNCKFENFEQRTLQEFQNRWNVDNKDQSVLTIIDSYKDKEMIGLQGLLLASNVIQSDKIITAKEVKEKGAYNAFIRKNINYFDYF